MQLRAVIMEGNPFHSSCNVFVLMGCIFVADPAAAQFSSGRNSFKDS
jgi:hypothetical protein